MQEILKRKLHEYMQRNNADTLVKLQAQGKITEYLGNKVSGIDSLVNELLESETAPFYIEEICMNTLTEDLRPSRYNYVMSILLDSFLETYILWQQNNVLLYEVINIINGCEELFLKSDFDQKGENDLLQQDVKAYIEQYLDK